MKADLSISEDVALAIILFVLVLLVFFNLLFVNNVQPTSYTSPQEKVECKTNSDCKNKNIDGVCISFNNQGYFCGCMDDNQCKVGACTNNRCS